MHNIDAPSADAHRLNRLQTIPLKMADQKWSEFYVVITMILSAPELLEVLTSLPELVSVSNQTLVLSEAI